MSVTPQQIREDAYFLRGRASLAAHESQGPLRRAAAGLLALAETLDDLDTRCGVDDDEYATDVCNEIEDRIARHLSTAEQPHDG